MRIVYMVEQFYLHGGIEKITAEKVNWLVSKGHEVYLISNQQFNKPLVYPLDNKVNFIDLKINYIMGKSYFHPSNLFKVPKHFNKLKKELKKIKPDIVVITSLQFDFYFLPFMPSIKTIREHHASRYYFTKEWLKKQNIVKRFKYKINHWIEGKYSYNIVLTKDELQHFDLSNISVIPNSIKIRKELKTDLDNKIVISAGRIAPVKGFEKLIEAWQIVAKNHADWKLNIYGDGDVKYKKILQNKIDVLHLQRQICLCGQTDDLEEKLCKSSIYAMSSKTECFPMVLLEAQAIGLPVVSFDCPYGPKNIINNMIDGILAENQNETKLAQAILKLIENNELRLAMGKQAKQNISNFSIEEIMKKWLYLFNS